jgi:hypothetical protein
MQSFDPDVSRPTFRLLSVEEARTFVSGFSKMNVPTGSSFKSFVRDPQWDNVLIDEGSPEFSRLRDEILRNAERSLFLAVSNFRRSLDLLNTSSAMWSQVTLYYSSYFAANTVLGCLGGVLDVPARAIGVSRGESGLQQLASFRWEDYSSGRSSDTHRKFWENFYRLVAPMRGATDADGRDPFQPFNSIDTWQTDHRNNVNYDTRTALDLLQSFGGAFNLGLYPDCLPGNLKIQFELSRSLVNAALQLGHTLKLATDGIDGIRVGSGFYDTLVNTVGSWATQFPNTRPLFVQGPTSSTPPRVG